MASSPTERALLWIVPCRAGDAARLVALGCGPTKGQEENVLDYFCSPSLSALRDWPGSEERTRGAVFPVWSPPLKERTAEASKRGGSQKAFVSAVAPRRGELPRDVLGAVLDVECFPVPTSVDHTSDGKTGQVPLAPPLGFVVWLQMIDITRIKWAVRTEL